MFICEISIIIILICQKLGSVGPVQHNNIKLNCLHLIWINVNALKVIQVNGEWQKSILYYHLIDISFDIPYLWEEVKIIAPLLHNSNYVNVAFMKFEKVVAYLKFF